MGSVLSRFDPQATYSAAAVDYDTASRKFWRFPSERTVEALGLRRGAKVLDVACGTGLSTVEAARVVGDGGSVVAVDYAEGMLDVARTTVDRAGLRNVEFVQGDMTALPYAAEFDAVICVLGIFFVDDMPLAVRRLWSHVRPGGRLAITTLGPEVFRPMIDRFVEACGEARPGIDVVRPWRRAEDSSVLRRVFEDASVPDVQITSELREIAMPPEEWWNVVMGSGLRRAATELGDAAAAVRADNERRARDNDVTALRIDAHYAMATKES